MKLNIVAGMTFFNLSRKLKPKPKSTAREDFYPSAKVEFSPCKVQLALEYSCRLMKKLKATTSEL